MTTTEEDPGPRVVLPAPLPYQNEILQDPHRFKVLDCGRQVGKTTMAGMSSFTGHGPIDPDTKLPLYQGAIQGKQGYWIAPTYDLADIAWRRIKEWLRPVWDQLRKSDASGKQWVEFPGGGRLAMRSADDPERLVGDTLDFVVVDEAAKCKPGTWELVQPMLTVRHTQRLRKTLSGGGWAFLISTPKGRNWFYKAWKLGQVENLDYRSWQLPSTASPLFSKEEEIRLRKEYTPYLFEREILARFTVADGSFFRRDWVSYSPPLATAPEVFLTASLPIDEESRGEQAASGPEGERHLVVGTWHYSRTEGSVLVNLHRELVAPATIPAKISEIAEKANARFLAVGHMEPLRSMAELTGLSTKLYPMDLLGVYDMPGPTDAAERAGPAASAILAKRMRFVEADWTEEFLAELFSFPDPEEERSCVEVVALAARVRAA